jgi:hypothetical protein
MCQSAHISDAGVRARRQGGLGHDGSASQKGVPESRIKREKP